MSFLSLQVDFLDITFRSHHPVITTLVQRLTDAESAQIEGLGLGYLCDLPNIRVNHGLLGALAECFHLETNTFHLLMAEMTVTPKDIYRIL